MAASSTTMCGELPECPICIEIFTQPKLISCGHSFCFKCLQRLVSDEEYFKCPVCRTMIIRPEDGIDAFPTNFALDIPVMDMNKLLLRDCSEALEAFKPSESFRFNLDYIKSYVTLGEQYISDDEVTIGDFVWSCAFIGEGKALNIEIKIQTDDLNRNLYCDCEYRLTLLNSKPIRDSILHQGQGVFTPRKFYRAGAILPDKDKIWLKLCSPKYGFVDENSEFRVKLDIEMMYSGKDDSSDPFE